MVLRWMVSNWIRSEAARRAEEALAEAARGAASNLAPEDQAEPAELKDCDIGLVFALPIESGGLVDLLEGTVKVRGAKFAFHEGALAGRSVVVAEAGAGLQNAAAATERLIEGHKPKWVVSAGFAGALDEKLRRNDILLANSVANLRGERLAVDFRMERAPRVHVGRLLTVDHVVGTPEQRRELRAAHDALAVDMETYAVAEVCRREKVRFLSIRVISDTVDEVLPRDIDHLLKQASLAGRLGAAAGSVFRRPSSVKDLWKLRENALVASDALAKFLKALLPQLSSL